jgi:hypothetical protein
MQEIAEFQDVDAASFERDIASQYRPAILRGFVKDWPAVKEARKSPEAICTYLMKFDQGAEVDAIMTPPAEQGRVFYQPDMQGFNFARNRLSITQVIHQLVRYSQFPVAPAVAVQSALVRDCLPGFLAENSLSVLDAAVQPRIWIGNTIVTPAHFDQSNNLACVVAGRRRFTLFPPEQVANLYIGPLDFAPTPTPISMVDFKQPDFARFPRFREALAHAQVAELGPGDAIFIPTLWWHHVESLEMLNILVNYWWGEIPRSDTVTASPFESMLFCLRNMKALPPEQRTAWAAMYAHYVFDANGDPAEHIPAHKRGVLDRR